MNTAIRFFAGVLTGFAVMATTAAPGGAAPGIAASGVPVGTIDVPVVHVVDTTKITATTGNGPTPGTGYWAHEIVGLGDLDGDGTPDIAVADYLGDTGGTDRGEFHVLFMNPDGSVRSSVLVGDGVGGLPAGTLLDGDTAGWGLANIGDLDGDDVIDLAFGAHNADLGGTNTGALHILFMNTDGTVRAVQTIGNDTGGIPSGTFADGANFGPGVQTIGDLDGDDVQDLVVGATGVGGFTGAVHVLFMNTDGTAKAHTTIADGVGGLPAGTLDPVDYFGFRIAPADVNGDGRAEVVVTAELDDDGGPNRGAIYTLFLDTDGTLASFTKIADGIGGLPAGTLDDDDLFGSAAGAAGDLDGDGRDEVLIGARQDDTGGTDRGAMYVLSLAADGSVQRIQTIADGIAGFPAGSMADSDRFAHAAVANIGDIDGDGVVDLAAGTRFDADQVAGSGAVHVLFLDGDSDGDGLLDHLEDRDPDGDGDPTTNPTDTDGDGTPDHLDPDDNGDGVPTASQIGDRDFDGQSDHLDGPQPTSEGVFLGYTKISDIDGGLRFALSDNDYLGRDVTAIGDVDGDGIVDIAIGMFGYNAFEGGVVIALLNHDGTVKAEQVLVNGSGGLPLGFNGAGDSFGTNVAHLGDTDGDGRPEIAVSAENHDGAGTNRGAVHILSLDPDGSVAAISTIASDSNWPASPLVDGSQFGYQGLEVIGDVNGDGFDDLLVGGRTGGSVTNAGHAYVVMLDAGHNVIGHTEIGSGGAGGLSATLDANDLFGTGVGAIGDLDGDGVPDAVVGAMADDQGGTDAGAVYVLFLNADGTVKAEQKIADGVGGLPAGALDPDDRFGVAPAPAGDLDGDGVNDLIVGAYRDRDGGDRHGATYVLFMNDDGTVKSHVKQTSTTDPLVGALNTHTYFGIGASTLGDLNGDGTMDMAVAADVDDAGGTNRGAVYILFGDGDADGDGIPNSEEDDNLDGDFNPATNPNDADGDGVPDGEEVDADGDGTLDEDELDTDSDNDGEPDRTDPTDTAVTVTASTTTVDPVPGDDDELVIVVTNTGNVTANAPVVEVTLPSGARIVEADVVAAGCRVVTNGALVTVACDLAPMPAGAVERIELPFVHPDVAGTNPATLRADGRNAAAGVASLQVATNAAQVTTTTTTSTSTSTTSTTVVTTAAPTTAAGGTAAPSTAPGTIAFTGSETARTTGLAAVLIGTGSALLVGAGVLRRRRL